MTTGTTPPEIRAGHGRRPVAPPLPPKVGHYLRQILAGRFRLVAAETTRRRVDSRTRGLSLNTRETVATETLLARATSRIVTMIAPDRAVHTPTRRRYRIRMPLLSTTRPPVSRRWNPSSIEEVTEERVQSFFNPHNYQELKDRIVGLES